MSAQDPPVKRAGALLDRPLPEGYRQDWAQHFARPLGGDEADSNQDHTVLLFRIGEEWLAIPTAIMQEVADPRRPHSLPHRRDNLVMGIVNIRGELLICVSLAALLGIEADTGQVVAEHTTAFTRMIVIGRDGQRVAFQVDEVHGVHRFSQGDLTDTPATVGRTGSSLATTMIAWKGRSVGRLDGALLLASLDRSIA